MNENSLIGARVLGLEVRRVSGVSSLASLTEGEYPVPFRAEAGWDGIALLRVGSEHLALELKLSAPDVRLSPVLVNEAGGFDAGFLQLSPGGSCELAVSGSLELREGRLLLAARVDGVWSVDGRERRVATGLDGSSRPARA